MTTQLTQIDEIAQIIQDTVSAGGEQNVAAGAIPLKITLKNRLDADGRWPTVEPLRDQMMREARKGKGGMSKEEAQDWVYKELDRLYPPLTPVVIIEKCEANGDYGINGDATTLGAVVVPRPREYGGIPESWPPLPANASLPVELAWVQAERLRVVEERAGGTAVVHLDRASTPAPSWGALAWLETSVRSHAKYIDVCARGLGQQELESETVKREGRGIEDVRALLRETTGVARNK